MYREVEEEEIETLEALLYELLQKTSKYQEFGCPLLPPNLSGMIHNLSRTYEYHDWRKFLRKFPYFVSVSGRKVKYIGPYMTKPEAVEELQYIIVQGIFIYFLAKFCHGPSFSITTEYYKVIIGKNNFKM